MGTARGVGRGRLDRLSQKKGQMKKPVRIYSGEGEGKKKVEDRKSKKRKIGRRETDSSGSGAPKRRWNAQTSVLHWKKEGVY